MAHATPRDAALRELLLERQRDMRISVQRRLRNGRVDRQTDQRDVTDQNAAESQSGIELALLQMHTATLVRLEEAIERLEAGRYGFCVECRGAISEQRLRTLPFAVCCEDCEAQRELVEARTRPRDQRRGALWLVPRPAGK